MKCGNWVVGFWQFWRADGDFALAHTLTGGSSAMVPLKIVIGNPESNIGNHD